MKKNNCKWIAIACGALTMTALAACNDYDEMTNESQATTDGHVLFFLYPFKQKRASCFFLPAIVVYVRIFV